MRFVVASLALLSIIPSSFAVPAPLPEATPTPVVQDAVTLEERQLLPGVASLLDGLLDNVNSAVAAKDPTGVVHALVKITPTARPSNIAEVVSKQSSIWAQSTRTDFYQAVATQIANGIILDDTLNTVVNGGLPVGENSITNNNPKPPTTIYPKKSRTDAPYTLSEAALRSAIYIPPAFTYGAKTPVLFVPGTGAYGGSNFASNLRKLLTDKPFADPIWLNIPDAMLGDAQTNSEYVAYGGSNFASNLRKLLTDKPFADPVWLNIPNAMLDDAQTNSEYVAYAINYISSISRNSKQIAVISWSQGGLDTQFALKYWPSTRKVVRDFLPVSPDFRGTVLANALCLSVGSEESLSRDCPPSVLQQEFTAEYVASVRRAGGDSAYVPTTTFYSGFFDEIVEPMQGSGASAFLGDARGVGVSNNEVQVVCKGGLAGSFYSHAGVLFNPLTYALIVDALENEGPGDAARVDLESVCGSYVAEGLDLDDVLATSGLVPVAATLLLLFPDKRSTEPPLRSYAQ